MNCRKCKKEIPEESSFCLFCGVNQTTPKQKTKSRGNGQGSVYKLPSGLYKAAVTLGYTLEGKRVVRTKSGFKTKKEALEYLPVLRDVQITVNKKMTWVSVYDEWKKLHEKKVSKSTMDCYTSAMKYYKEIYFMDIKNIRTSHLQNCVSNCPKGRRTRENMKALGTLLFDYAIQQDIVDKNFASFIYIGKFEKTERQAFTKEQIEVVASHIHTIPYASYILALIYTGFRINELLSLQCKDCIAYDTDKRILVGGSKTEAGKNRIVPVSRKIQPIVERLIENKSPNAFIFSDASGNRITDDRFRKNYYYKALEAMNLPLLSPHCCRHTFATLIKDVDSPATDKQKIMGHTSFEMTAHYTHTNIDDLWKIIENI